MNITAGKLTIMPQSLQSNVNDLNITGSGQLDLTNNSLLIHDTTQLASIVALLTSGYDHGNWDGAGIMSSSVATQNGHTTIGYNIINLGTTSSPNNVIIVKYTLPGINQLSGTRRPQHQHGPSQRCPGHGCGSLFVELDQQRCNG